MASGKLVTVNICENTALCSFACAFAARKTGSEKARDYRALQHYYMLFLVIGNVNCGFHSGRLTEYNSRS